MVNNAQNNKNSNSEVVPFNISKLSNLQYIKIIFIGKNNELHEIQTKVNTINDELIQLYSNSNENINISCPTGVALKLVTMDAIYFAKTVLKDIKKASDKYIFILDTPHKTIRQQNRRYYRININRPCVVLVDNNKDHQTYIAQSVNISKGGVLLNNLETMLTDEKVGLKLDKGGGCHIAMFLEQDLKIKSYAKFVRNEFVDGTYRYAFQFVDMSRKYIIPFDKYLTNEEFKLLKSIKNK